jgi:hypothetical protein
MRSVKMAALPVTALVLGMSSGSAQAQVRAERVERVQFARGATSATVRGQIRGYGMVDYLVNARAGQRMTVSFAARGRSTYFLVRAPGSEDNLFDGSSSGDTARLTLPATGTYRIRVFQMRNVARRGARSNYSLSVRVDG